MFVSQSSIHVHDYLYIYIYIYINHFVGKCIFGCGIFVFDIGLSVLTLLDVFDLVFSIVF